MALNKNIAVGTKHFTGQANVQHDREDGLSAIVRDILVRDTKALLVAVGTSVLTDSSAGVDGVTFAATVVGDLVTLSGVIAESWVTGDGPFQMASATTLPAGLAASTDYYVRRTSSNVATLHLTKKAALSAQSTPVTITDVGTGVHKIHAIGQATALVTDDGTDATDSFTAASGDTSFDSVNNALATLAERINLALDSMGAGNIDEGAETPGSGTIAAVDVDVAANSSNTTGVTFASAVAIVAELDNSQATVIDALNVARVAVGLGKVPVFQNVIGTVDVDGLNGGDAITDSVTTTATTIATSATEAGIEIVLARYAHNVALLATLTDAVTSITAAAAPAAYAG